MSRSRSNSSDQGSPTRRPARPRRRLSPLVVLAGLLCAASGSRAHAGFVTATIHPVANGSYWRYNGEEFSEGRHYGEVIAGNAFGREFVGVMEFDLRAARPLPGAAATLNLVDSGGKVVGDSTTVIRSYAGDGAVRLDDVDPAGASSYLTVTRPFNGGTTNHDATTLLSQYAGKFLGLNFKDAGTGSQDAFGGGDSTLTIKDDAMAIIKSSPLQVVTGRVLPGLGFISKDAVPGTGGNGIGIHFAPKNSLGQNVPIADLAAALGDGIVAFSWVQHIIHMPASVRLERRNSDGTSTELKAFDKAETNLIDPDTVADNQNQLIVSSQITGQQRPLANMRNDHLDPYYPLSLTPAGTSRDFIDSPALGAGFFGPGEYLQFQTDLVGLRADGTDVDLGVGLTWKSNATIDFNGSVFLANPDGLPAGFATTGGIFDIEPSVAAVPEPSSALHLGLACFALAAVALRRHFRGRPWRRPCWP